MSADRGSNRTSTGTILQEAHEKRNEATGCSKRFANFLASQQLSWKSEGFTRDAGVFFGLLLLLGIVAKLLSGCGLFGKFGLLVYVLVIPTMLIVVLLIYIKDKFCPDPDDDNDGDVNEHHGSWNKFKVDVWEPRVEQLKKTVPLFKSDKVPMLAMKWGVPMVCCGWCLFTNMWLLHGATYFYILEMDRTNKAYDGPPQEINFKAAKAFAGPFGTPSPGLNVTSDSYGSVLDVFESRAGPRVDVPMRALDVVSATLPGLFMLGIVLTADLILWTKVMICFAYVMLLKGMIDFMTVLPDSSGWEVCQARLGQDALDFFRREEMNPFRHGFWNFYVQLIHAEIDGPHHNRILSGMRWCSDMMLSGHTQSTFTFALGLLELLQKQVVQKHIHAAVYWVITVFIFCEQVLEITLVVENRFHYVADVFVAVVMCLVFYTNGPVVVCANWWAKQVGSAENRWFHQSEGELWVPPFCVPFCCFGRMNGFHELQWHSEETAIEHELTDMKFGKLVFWTDSKVPGPGLEQPLQTPPYKCGIIAHVSPKIAANVCEMYAILYLEKGYAHYHACSVKVRKRQVKLEDKDVQDQFQENHENRGEDSVEKMVISKMSEKKQPQDDGFMASFKDKYIDLLIHHLQMGEHGGRDDLGLHAAISDRQHVVEKLCAIRGRLADGTDKV